MPAPTVSTGRSTLISVQQAQHRIAEAVHQSVACGAEPVSLTAADNRILAENIIAQQDLPPFDKALMDGYALNVSESVTKYTIVEEVTAGHVPEHNLQAGQATRIMTGAQIPSGTTTVIPFEQSHFDDASNTVSFPDHTVEQNKNILWKGTLQQIGDVILQAGTVLHSQQIAILAELGCILPRVYQKPKVAVLATGDELVPFDQTPAAGQIRNSNAIMLASQVRHAGGEPVLLGIARDDEAEMKSLFEQGLQCDLLILSGGVSSGKKDLAPGILAEVGVREIFHKVRLKPGKPCWFGLHNKQNSDQATFVFGLPGNPVSSFVCFELFARSVIEQLGHIPPSSLKRVKSARLQQNYIAENDRPTYHPGRLSCTESGLEVEMLPWKGSADLSGLRNANALVAIPDGPKTYSPGEFVDIIPL